ncbi:MAG TPA: alkaline phosphatase family protein, partial [Candidatus Tectomicrobia bacterium]|nr:alkaline phosphatase family protein [Candidatus Tectomicrobia bacterium]
RLVRRLRLGRAPRRARRRLLVVQIDGLSRAVLERALAEGRMPFLRRLLQRGGYRLHPMAVGMPTSTPAFQMAAMYGVAPDIPGFHYHDKRRRSDVYFPRAGDAAHVEATQAAGRQGIVEGGSTYGCVFAGGAVNNLFTFALLKQPSGAGLLRALSAGVVLGWVVVKSLGLSVYELTRAALAFVADPVGAPRGWKLLAIKIGISVWVRELFTLSASRDLYAGVPAVYVNYLDYDIVAHAFGPRSRPARRSLRAVDRSIRQLWRVCRRVPEHGWDLYVLADHGQAHCTPYDRLTGRRVERLLIEDFFAPAGAHEVGPARPAGRRIASGIKAVRRGRAPGLVQRFLNYLEQDFPWLLGETPEARERDGVRVIAAGPNAFVYLLNAPTPFTLEAIDAMYPGLVDELSRAQGIGFVLARSERGPVCAWRGKRYRLDELGDGPFAGREDLDLLRRGVRDLMGMRCAGDLVIYGTDTPQGHVSYIAEVGAHAGPSPDELYTFLVTPPGVDVPAPITHPLELYPLFVRYHRAA